MSNLIPDLLGITVFNKKNVKVLNKNLKL